MAAKQAVCDRDAVCGRERVDYVALCDANVSFKGPSATRRGDQRGRERSSDALATMVRRHADP